MLETNLDDASPQIIGHVMDRVLELGRLIASSRPFR